MNLYSVQEKVLDIFIRFSYFLKRCPSQNHYHHEKLNHKCNHDSFHGPFQKPWLSDFEKLTICCHYLDRESVFIIYFFFLENYFGQNFVHRTRPKVVESLNSSVTVRKSEFKV